AQNIVQDDKAKEGELYSKQHEVSRRLLENRIWEVFYYMHRKMQELPISHSSVVNRTEDQLISLLATAANFSEIEGAGAWRKKSLQAVTNTIQQKIRRMQNPEDCRTAKALVCNLDKECGFGCQLHHVAYCFLTAFGSGRMLVLNRDGSAWR
ncbi:unnamed protein product, partial [Cylicostephanus goldi]